MGKTRRSAKKWPAEALNPAAAAGQSQDERAKPIPPQMAFEETNYMSSILPLKSIEESHNYFRMDFFCALHQDADRDELPRRHPVIKKKGGARRGPDGKTALAFDEVRYLAIRTKCSSSLYNLTATP